ncbi:MaoC/PaaZ C-terminal domain-containing protein [Nocardioides alcanivorans]|uniref:MaoC/PaaZ C-terminal domain-containing protein n=1 Tax=Nocardioides alcanivorans TaxID=2897352 RepID=UPI001F3D5168|nr:MaoC/PaaZ C-terminal domain-containing protein [Nocardioides alcanivorans]
MTSIGTGTDPRIVTWQPLRPGRISRTTLALFGGASGDHNPIHLDLDFARANGRDDVFAHGMLSMAYLGRLLTDHVEPGDIESFQVRFSAITEVNAEPVCTAEVRAVEDGIAELELKVEVDGVVTLIGDARVRVPAAG